MTKGARRQYRRAPTSFEIQLASRRYSSLQKEAFAVS
jgi:hypothetical protein